jgi:hypothetical protein
MCKNLVPRIKTKEYVFAQFRTNISVQTLQQLYCPQLMQHNAAALRCQLELNEVCQVLQTRNVSERAV